MADELTEDEHGLAPATGRTRQASLIALRNEGLQAAHDFADVVGCSGPLFPCVLSFLT